MLSWENDSKRILESIEKSKEYFKESSFGENNLKQFIEGLNVLGSTINFIDNPAWQVSATDCMITTKTLWSLFDPGECKRKVFSQPSPFITDAINEDNYDDFFSQYNIWNIQISGFPFHQCTIIKNINWYLLTSYVDIYPLRVIQYENLADIFKEMLIYADINIYNDLFYTKFPPIDTQGSFRTDMLARFDILGGKISSLPTFKILSSIEEISLIAHSHL
jgi:hypothetical protein